MLKRLIARGLKYEEGILFVIDGSKGIIKAVKEVFGNKAIHQRCQWRKRENIISHLKLADQDEYRGRIQQAYNENDYGTARKKPHEIAEELK
jgi:transposase-like protein